MQAADPESPDARSSWFRHMVARLATKAANTSETPDPDPNLFRAAKSQQKGLPDRHPNPAA